MSSTEAQNDLMMKAETIDPASIGLQTGPYTALLPVDIRAIEQQLRIITAAQALMQVINTSPAGLVLRDIYVQYDLLDGAGAVITSGDWRQPVTGNFATATGNIKADGVTVYTTGINSRFTMKVLTFYGVELVMVGNLRGHKASVSNALQFKRGIVKLIDIIDIQSIDNRDPPMLIFRAPIMYKASDDGNIIMVPDAATPADANKIDHIKFIAVVCESLGASQTG